MKVHEIIFQQLGAGKFVAMSGARNFGYTENSLHFKIMGSKKVSHVTITINGKDLYDIKYVKIWGTKIKNIHESNDVYFDMLKTDIENVTGLYLTLF